MDTNTVKEEKQKENTQTALKNVVKKKKSKWYFIIPLILLLFILFIFIGWYFAPKKTLDVAVIDKTILPYSGENKSDKSNMYRKHYGFYWILDQQKYVKRDGSYYNYKNDYYGPVLNDEGKITGSREIKNITSMPDLLYISDAYGVSNDSLGYYNGKDPLSDGITVDDMSVISNAYETGSAVIGEMTIFGTTMTQSVRTQMTDLLGITPTGWVGRFFHDLENFNDLPDWAKPMYEQQEGIEWRFNGPGIILCSESGKILVFQQNEDFSSKNLLKIYINEEYKSEFSGVSSCNFYNWFELIEANYGTESIATFEFDFNTNGMERFKEVSKYPRFTAITRKCDANHAPVYYFAGDFNDYTSGTRYSKFLFANQFFKLISYDTQGDITHFFWRFYDPLIRHILKETEESRYSETNKTEHADVSRITAGTFQVYINDSWADMPLRCVSINANEPGKNEYSRDLSYYEKLIYYAYDLGVNCIYVKDLLPPEFYSALYKYNKSAGERNIYVLQTVKIPDNADEDTGAKSIENTIKALHGSAIPDDDFTDFAYFTDISAYILGYTIDISGLKVTDQYSYTGTYTNSGSGKTGFCSYLVDTAFKFYSKEYGYFSPIALHDDMRGFGGTKLSVQTDATDVCGVFSDEYKKYEFIDITLDKSLLSEYAKAEKSTYAGYEKLFRETNKAYDNVIISNITYSNVNGILSQNAITESEQADRIITVLSAVDSADLIGGVVFDLNDDWSALDEKSSVYTVPLSENSKWHNKCDESQSAGLIATEAAAPENVGLMLSDDDRLQHILMSANEEYLYITVQLTEDIDYINEALFIGIDTYQRNDGEYYYSSEFTHNSLSGMEYVLRFDSKQNALLYVIPTYNRESGEAYTKEIYDGEFDKIAKLTYGGFSKGDNHFYQTGTTIYVRLPWTWLNVTNPNAMLVINDKSLEGREQAHTVMTNGMLVSVMIGERGSGDMLYAFPRAKSDPGYKTFRWELNEVKKYVYREKESFTALKKYYSGK